MTQESNNTTYRKTIYKIASKNISVLYQENSSSSKVLEKELSLYPQTNDISDIEFIISDVVPENNNLVSVNPSKHKEYILGFSIDFNNNSILWEKNDNRWKIYFKTDSTKKILKKFRNIQFSYSFEQTGQIFHELALIPALFLFSKDLTLIHGCSLESSNGNGIIIAGTGGVGKTSMELSLIFNNNFSFISDDISILDKSGFIWPNYAFPKIYGYNTVGNKFLENKLLRDKKIFDKIQWFIKKGRSPLRVRRRVNPIEFFDGKVSRGCKLSDIYFLFRCKCDGFSVKQVSSESLAKLNIEIIKSEYNAFFQHLYWHKANREILGENIFINDSIVLNQWKKIQMNIFNNCNCYIVQLPLNAQIDELQSWFLNNINL